MSLLIGALGFVVDVLSDLVAYVTGKVTLRELLSRRQARSALKRATRRAVRAAAAALDSPHTDRGDLAKQLGAALGDLDESDILDGYGNLVLRDALARRLADFDPAADTLESRVAARHGLQSTGILRVVAESLHSELARRGLPGGSLESLQAQIQAVRKDYFDSPGPNRIEFGGTGFAVPRSDDPLIGREDDLADLYGHCRSAGGSAVLWIHGEPGSGKTTLAAALARRLDEHDGATIPFLRMRGGAREVDGGAYRDTDPYRTLADLLRYYAIDGADRLTADDQRAQWRALVRQRNVRAVVLDDVRDATQIEPFLPGDGHCIVVVTSRNAPSGLLTQRWPIRPLPVEAVLAYWMGLEAEETAVMTRIAGKVSGIPLLLPLVRNLSAPRQLLAETPAGAGTGVDQLVSTAHRLVIDRLAPAHRRSLALVAGQPGFRLTADGLAAMARIRPDDAAAHLELLVESGLLKHGDGDSYAFHHRTSALVAERLDELIDQSEMRAARLRLLEHQLAGARAAHDCFDDSPNRRDRTVRRRLTPEEAQRWLGTERRNLREAMRYHRTADDPRTRRVLMSLCRMLGVPMVRAGFTQDAEQFLTTAIDQAARLGDVRAEAEARRSLGGRVYRMLDLYAEANEQLDAALGLFRELDDPVGEADALCGLGHVARLAERYDVAAEHLEAARKRYDQQDLARGKGDSLLGLGEVAARREPPDLETAERHYVEAARCFLAEHDLRGIAESYWGQAEVARLRGDLGGAAERYRSALDLARQSHDRLVEADALRGEGYVAMGEDRHEAALDRFTEAVALYRHIMDKVGTADALLAQGEALLALGRRGDAATILREARKLYGELGHSREDTARRLLRDRRRRLVRL
jgi:tetratricopeptide (TPR) repeat protein